MIDRALVHRERQRLPDEPPSWPTRRRASPPSARARLFESRGEQTRGGLTTRTWKIATAKGVAQRRRAGLSGRQDRTVHDLRGGLSTARGRTCGHSAPDRGRGAWRRRLARGRARPRRQPQEANGYTRYELLAPGSGKFRIIYDITAVRPGATAFFNPIRKGSIASDESVTDLATGKPLKFAQVSGESAKTTGLPDADPASDYIRVELAHPVPADGGEARILIEKTYEDAKSYRVDGQDIVFDRGLGIKKNAVVLPKGYVLVSCNYPSPGDPGGRRAPADQLLQHHARRGAAEAARRAGRGLGRAPPA